MHIFQDNLLQEQCLTLAEYKTLLMKQLLFALLAIGTAILIFSFQNNLKQPAEMKQYWLVLLKRGPNRGQDSAAAAKIQSAHMANMDRMHAAGKLVMAGPIGDKSDLRGIFIMDVANREELDALIAKDSALITGRLEAEVHSWWTEKGNYVFK